MRNIIISKIHCIAICRSLLLCLSTTLLPHQSESREIFLHAHCSEMRTNIKASAVNDKNERKESTSGYEKCETVK